MELRDLCHCDDCKDFRKRLEKTIVDAIRQAPNPQAILESSIAVIGTVIGKLFADDDFDQIAEIADSILRNFMDKGHAHLAARRSESI